MKPQSPWPVARLTPRFLQCALLGATLVVTAAVLGDRIGSGSAPVQAIAAAGLLFVLPFACSAATFTRHLFPERLLIVGTGALARKLVEELAQRRHGPDLIVGIADDVSGPVEPPLRDLVAGPLTRLGTLIEELRPDRIVVALADRRGRLPVSELLEARVRGVAVEDAVDLYERLTGKLAIESLTPSNLISSKDFRKSHFDLASGHVASIAASAIGLVVLAPLFGLIALAIKLDSPGPVFFVQDRVGLGGRRFRLIKFRTMRPAEHATSEWAGDNGDRITPLGRWLRKFRLDELPQLINVIRGEMNLVGPRPHPVSNFELFREHIPYYSLRAVIRPGLTGWAQVRQGYANSLEEETEKMRYDLYYIKHMSAWLDLRILLRTVQTVLGGRESTAARRARGNALVAGDMRFVTVSALSDRIAAVPRRSPRIGSPSDTTRREREGETMKPERATSLIAIALLALTAAPISAAPLQDLKVMGSGTAETNCPGTLTPNCTIRTEGTVTASADGTLLFDGVFAIRFDTASAGTLNGWPAGAQSGTQQGLCAPAAYLGTLTAANGDVVSFANVGTVCEEAAVGSAIQFNGTFRITGGTGQFAAAAGAGNVVVTATSTRGTAAAFVNMTGTITY